MARWKEHNGASPPFFYRGRPEATAKIYFFTAPSSINYNPPVNVKANVCDNGLVCQLHKCEKYAYSISEYEHF